ncbi:MAG TPA: dTMP kinase [Anaerolineales bacterium]
MFITFEGSEGCGKTTQVAGLSTWLCQQGYPVLVTREPGGTPIGDQIREVLFSMRNTDMEPRAEILLFQASRAQLVSRVILPHLQQGGIVLSDRYADSTLAYQGYGYQLDLAPLRALIDFATGGLKPDLTLLLDLDVEVGLKRRSKAGDINRLDAYQVEFYQRVRSGYHQMVEDDPQRWAVIDAAQPAEQVQTAVRQVVLDRLKARREL